jgi:threonine synthase
MDLESIRSKINSDYFKSAPPAASKYLPFMPVKDYSTFVTLGEGATPLIKSSVIGPELGIDLYFKLESRNPTGAFKDRGSAVEVTIAKELGAKGIVVASTGNMAASCSCYAAAAHIPCFVFVPEDTPSSKLAQVISYGGRIVQVKGSYGDAAALAEEVARELGLYLAGDYAFRVEGHKTAAFEVIEQLYFNEPDAVFVPVGCGTNLASYMKGFEEYQSLGFIDKLPKIYGSQAEGAPTVARAFDQGLKEGVIVESANTVAKAICINRALDASKALDAIYKTNGKAIAVNDREILEAQYQLSRGEGLFVEAACASALASLKRVVDSDNLKGKTVVLVLTGSGLKDPSAVLKIAIKPPTIYPDIKDFLSLYDASFFEGKTVAFVDSDQVLFEEEPSVEEIAQQLNDLFEAHYSPQHIERIKLIAKRFLNKGKSITFLDFQDIVQDSLEAPSKALKPVFSVLDFSVKTGMDKKSEATVKVKVNGDELTANADGVGPVDAVISALRVACGEKMDFSLADYKVHIRSSGTNAVVNTELKLRSKSLVSVGVGASPDIIQASIEAFEEAYNGFYRGKE